MQSYPWVEVHGLKLVLNLLSQHNICITDILLRHGMELRSSSFAQWSNFIKNFFIKSSQSKNLLKNLYELNHCRKYGTTSPSLERFTCL